MQLSCFGIMADKMLPQDFTLYPYRFQLLHPHPHPHPLIRARFPSYLIPQRCWNNAVNAFGIIMSLQKMLYAYFYRCALKGF